MKFSNSRGVKLTVSTSFFALELIHSLQKQLIVLRSPVTSRELDSMILNGSLATQDIP